MLECCIPFQSNTAFAATRTKPNIKQRIERRSVWFCMVKVSKELSNSVAMVTVKTSTRSRNRLLAHYMLLAASLGFLLLTIRIVTSDKSSTGIRSKTVVRSARIQDGRPHLIYGTAWKKDETSRLVKEAVKAGFRFFDTACQPKHYDEAAVGRGLAKAMEEMKLKRADISIQTKFTPLSGQDPKNVPYHTENSIGDQAKESLMVSMKNLQVDYIDSWILHSPPKSNEDLMEVWRVMEEMANTQRVIKIGISNCYDIEVFRLLYKQAKHKPNVSKTNPSKSIAVCLLSNFSDHCPSFFEL